MLFNFGKTVVDIDVEATRRYYDNERPLNDCTCMGVRNYRKYVGDERSQSELDYCNSLSGTDEFEECIVFSSRIYRESDEERYGWEWVLARSYGGEWKLISYGYA